jgi:P4 family phage/plasmid primase-like protien
MAAEKCMLEGLSRTESHEEDVCIIDVEKVKGAEAGENGYKLAARSNAVPPKNGNDIIHCKVYKAFDEIPEILKNPDFDFILVKPWQKKPQEKNWQKTKLTKEDFELYDATGDLSALPRLSNYKYSDEYFLKKLEEGYNYGIICNENGPKVFDADDLKRLEELGVMQKLPKTFTVKTQSGNQHKYYYIIGMENKIIFYDPERFHAVKGKNGTYHEPDHLGEVQCGKVFVVGPGSVCRDSFNGPERYYEVIDDSPIATITLEQLNDILSGLKVSKERHSTKKDKTESSRDGGYLAEKIGLKIEDLIEISNLRHIGANELQGSHPVHGSENGNNFVVNLEDQSWCCFRHMDGDNTSGGDAINLAAVVYGIIDCGECVKGFWDTPEGKKKYPLVMDALRNAGYEIPELKYYDLTDIGNAERFADLYENELKYFTSKGEWLYWNGKMWVDCTHLEEERYSKEIPKMIKEEAERITDEDLKKKVFRWANISASYRGLKNTLSTAKSDKRFTIDITDFLSDTRYFNMQNGVLDTETFEFLPHDKNRLLSKMSNVVYDPAAKCPLWVDMMDMIFGGDKELIEFVQRFLGYILTGKPIEQAWFTFYGPKSKNGKSTFCNAVTYALGDYAKKVNIKTFLNAKNKSSIPNDIAALAGYYFIWASEPEEGSKLSMEIIKPFSGNEEMDARFLNKEFFQFKPQGSIIIVSNNRLIIDEKGDAAWRRALSIPFEVQIPEEKRLLDIDTLLQKEASGIFNWMVEGLREYYGLDKHLNPPFKVIESNAQYREDMNSFMKFWDEMVVFDSFGAMRNSDLWSTYKDFCVEYGLNSGLKKEFTNEVKSLTEKHPFEERIVHKQVVWKGIRQKTDDERNA